MAMEMGEGERAKARAGLTTTSVWDPNLATSCNSGFQWRNCEVSANSRQQQLVS